MRVARLLHQSRFWIFALALVAGQLLAAKPAQAWWNADWPYRLKVTANTAASGANITAPIGRAQVLLRLIPSNFNFSSANQDGSDLRVVAGDDRTPLNFHIEKFDPTTDMSAAIWVDVPNLAPNASSWFYIYWGNTKAAAGSDAKSTYDANQLLDYHFAEENGVPKDSTAYASNGVTGGKRDSSGIAGYGLKLDGSAGVQIDNAPTLAITAGSPHTWSFWFKPAAVTTNATLFSDVDASGSGISIDLVGGVPQVNVSGQTATGTGVISSGAWHRIDVTADKDIELYVDGVKQGTIAAKLPDINGTSTIGGGKGAAGANFVGLIDEFQIAKVSRGAGVIAVEYASESPTGKLLAYASPEQNSTGVNYVQVIVKSVTPDAWVVIIMLAIMSALSWWVMVAKALYINSLEKANKLFNQQYRKLVRETKGNHREALIKIAQTRSAKLKDSSLLRLARATAIELEDQIILAGDHAEELPRSGVSALRVVADSGLAEESKRLSRAMVLLTISISGGPFLGLLGTVVGVMIVFAAVAAAGDVNVNAIAPGIAAALLATVTGLFVAIPAMFGYNYFLIRIRDANGDMAHFIEELLVRISFAVQLHPQAGE
jgi:biopolymer transport protein ExbB